MVSAEAGLIDEFGLLNETKREMKMDYINRTIKFRFLILFLLFLGVVSSAFSAPRLIVEARESGRFVEFKIKNSSNNIVSIFKNSLPWSSPGGVRMFAFCGLKDPKPLREFLVSGYDPNFVQVPPLGGLSGKINLEIRFPDLKFCLETVKSAVFFWFYRSNTEDESPVEEFNGMFVLQ